MRVESFSWFASAMIASFSALAWARSTSRACDHLRRAWLNVVRAAEKRFHSASACGLSMCTDVR